jgi:hypothetical protein
MLQLLFQMARPLGQADRVLNGPTSEVWITPWEEYLRDTLNVTFHTNVVVERIECDGAHVAHVEVRHKHRKVPEPVQAAYYVAALPVEVMSSLAAESKLERFDSAFANISRLTTRWMNGVMFYLRNDVELVHGHTVYIDSPWALTSISQRQFWAPEYDPATMSDGTVSGILSVDVSDWDTPGEVHHVPAKDCTKKEIETEVWHQLTTRVPELADAEPVQAFVDPDISVHEKDNPHKYRDVNAEPLLINTPGSWYLRPLPKTGIDNLFLASDYVQTSVQLATMEGANEAARLAVNEILKKCQRSQESCEVWPLHEPAIFAPLQALDRIRFDREHPRAVRRSPVAVGVLPLPVILQPPAPPSEAETKASAVRSVRQAIARAVEAGELEGPRWELEADDTLGDRPSSHRPTTILYNPGHDRFKKSLGSTAVLADHLCDLAASEIGLAGKPSTPEDLAAVIADLRGLLRQHLSG